MYQVLKEEDQRKIGVSINAAALTANVKHRGNFVLSKVNGIYFFQFGLAGEGDVFSGSSIEEVISKAVNHQTADTNVER